MPKHAAREDVTMTLTPKRERLTGLTDENAKRLARNIVERATEHRNDERFMALVDRIRLGLEAKDPTPTVVKRKDYVYYNGYKIFGYIARDASGLTSTALAEELVEHFKANLRLKALLMQVEDENRPYNDRLSDGRYYEKLYNTYAERDACLSHSLYLVSLTPKALYGIKVMMKRRKHDIEKMGDIMHISRDGCDMPLVMKLGALKSFAS